MAERVVVPPFGGGHNAVRGRAEDSITFKEFDQLTDAEKEFTTARTELATVTAGRDTVFRGSMLRNALLTSYGFGILGEKATQGALMAFLAAALLGLLSVVGFVHAAMTPKSKAFAPVEPERRVTRERELTHV